MLVTFGLGLNKQYELHTSWQVVHSEAVLDKVAGLPVTPALQAGVLLLRRLQHVVTAQTLTEGKMGNIS